LLLTPCLSVASPESGALQQVVSDFFDQNFHQGDLPVLLQQLFEVEQGLEVTWSEEDASSVFKAVSVFACAFLQVIPVFALFLQQGLV
jgi:hypothetical protein